MFNRIQMVLSALHAHKVDFVLCGGVACVLQGCERTTQDLDVYIALQPANLQRAIKAFRSINFQPRIPEPMEALLEEEKRKQWLSEKNAIVYTLVSPDGILQTDIFLSYPVPWQELRENAYKMTIGDTPILVSSRQDLIRAKQHIHPQREKDMWDIRVLKELEKNE